jgi:hypothetical protein
MPVVRRNVGGTFICGATNQLNRDYAIRDRKELDDFPFADWLGVSTSKMQLVAPHEVELAKSLLLKAAAIERLVQLIRSRDSARVESYKGFSEHDTDFRLLLLEGAILWNGEIKCLSDPFGEECRQVPSRMHAP